MAFDPLKPPGLRPLPMLIFASRWLQVPLYLLLWQTVIHGMFLASAVSIALIDRIMIGSAAADKRNGHPNGTDR